VLYAKSISKNNEKDTHMRKVRQGQGGFAMLELVVLVILVLALAGVGLYIAHKRHATTPMAATSNGQTTAAAKPGTTSSVDQITTQAAASEQNSVDSYDTEYQQAATSDNSAMSNLGGAYNESTL
jgi:cytoskeletal protein RodZ